jgi:MFS family permease
LSQPASHDSADDIVMAEVVHNTSPRLPQAAEQFGVPRRFGIGTILVVIGAASVLLAFLVACGVPAPAVFSLVAFLALVALGQAILFRGTNPRLASIVSGAIICPVYAIGAAVVFSTIVENARRRDDLYCTAVAIAILGSLFGYLAGGVVGGIFLIMDRWEQHFGRKVVKEHFDPFAPEDRAAKAAPEIRPD